MLHCIVSFYGYGATTNYYRQFGFISDMTYIGWNLYRFSWTDHRAACSDKDNRLNWCRHFAFGNRICEVISCTDYLPGP
jgi:hypothetical protein